MKAKTRSAAFFLAAIFFAILFANSQFSHAAATAGNANSPELGRYVLAAQNLTTVAIIYNNEGNFGISLDTSNDEEVIWSTELMCACKDNVIFCGSVDNIGKLQKLPENQILALSFDDKSLKVINPLPEMHGKKNIKNAVFKLDERQKDCPNKTIPGGAISGKLKGITRIVDEFDNEVPAFEILLESGKEELVVVDHEDADTQFGKLIGKNISVYHDNVNNWSPITGTCFRYKKFNRMDSGNELKNSSVLTFDEGADFVKGRYLFETKDTSAVLVIKTPHEGDADYDFILNIIASNEPVVNKTGNCKKNGEGQLECFTYDENGKKINEFLLQTPSEGILEVARNMAINYKPLASMKFKVSMREDSCNPAKVTGVKPFSGKIRSAGYEDPESEESYVSVETDNKNIMLLSVSDNDAEALNKRKGATITGEYEELLEWDEFRGYCKNAKRLKKATIKKN